MPAVDHDRAIIVALVRGVASLPTYTQLGMASLLPNKDLQIADNETSAVIVDGQSSLGLENRKKILAKGREGDRTTALPADELMSMPKDDCRALFRDHDVIYVYHKGSSLSTYTWDTEANTSAIFLSDLKRALLPKAASAKTELRSQVLPKGMELAPLRRSAAEM